VPGLSSALVPILALVPEALRLAAIVVEPGEAGERLDRLLARRLGVPARTLRAIALGGRLRVDGRALLAGSPRLPEGAIVELLSPAARPELLPERLPLPLLFEDGRCLLVDKPAGMVVHPGPRHAAGTLANALRGTGRPLSSVEGPLRPGIVHRLDAGTSGVMVVAKDDAVHAALARCFEAHEVERRYLALVRGTPAWEETTVEAALGKRRRGRRAFAVCARGKSSRTRFFVVRRLEGHALVGAEPATGRTHQIRVHLASLGSPVLGDTLYDGGAAAARRASRLGLGRLALHAARLAIPALGLEANAPLPPDLAAVIERLSGVAPVTAIG
jgi:23S rRNA pseudouridine1911/1915/1917 synthase